jgi:endonuclease YncB( thermonuclease family)
VLKVVDGDTVDIVDDVRGRLRIRLLGIDTPQPGSDGSVLRYRHPADARRRRARPRPAGLCVVAVS